MDNINFGIACDVSKCRYNHNGCNCTLNKIHVGNACACEGEECTCCESFEKKGGSY